MDYVLYIVFILACFALVVSVLLQPGKADAGALFTSSVSSTAFGPRGTQTLLAKITIGAAALFMLIALTLALPGMSGPRSVVDGDTADAPVTPQSSPQTTAPPATVEQNGSAQTNVDAANGGNANQANTNTTSSVPVQASPATNANANR